MILVVHLTFTLPRGYSLGVVIMEITTGEKNFSSKQDMSARDFVDKARLRLENIFYMLNVVT
jgi:hypothetical protein